MTPEEQRRARQRIETAAEIDPDTYVPILDALDEETFDREPEESDGGRDPQNGVPVNEHCPCCGSRTATEYWTT
jgi:hypothetical protein